VERDVDGETQRQIAELDERRGAHRDRLQILEIQAARMGRSAPPEVVTEIREIKATLVPIDAAIFKLTYVGNVRSDVPGNDRPDDYLSMAVERTLERHRRATVAAQTDQLMFLEVRLETALSPIRTALYVCGALAIIAILLTSGALIYTVLK
jgi:hypothetical protein